MENRRSVLVFDDNVSDLILVKSFLSDFYNVEMGKNIKEAWAILNTGKIDLILLDVQMPEISGLDFIELLKKDEKSADIPVIFVSSYTEDYFKDLSVKKGAAGYVTKPIIASVLYNKIVEVLNPQITVSLESPMIVTKLDVLISACRKKDYVSLINSVNEFRKLDYDKETDEKVSELCSFAMQFDFANTVRCALKMKRKSVNNGK